jgi:hypothetical protein
MLPSAGAEVLESGIMVLSDPASFLSEEHDQAIKTVNKNMEILIVGFISIINSKFKVP